MQKPDVKIKDWIGIGESRPLCSPLYAVVCNISHDDIEVVYLQNDHKPVKQEVIWDGETWQFNTNSGITLREGEGYEFIQILKNR
ncbi:MAG: hypothetical protein US71_C0001G0063 [Parcubacteria group bacterium GW2011_GWD2_38_12]|uniref:Uncharacterized protein n=1 Tax=Candidatus Magasanikbacteria bacterium GW2011_GWE2_42_7 TaxID=1619052 RepID=A0A0G1BC93_9BACT|nr:MAG: hypothetical protein US06_C0001G0062 [Parcubacteria group bacterium GW2011_GWC2_36_17]KKQ52860.1 MAG: hypothetical protein US71_C0001G0063 [Parcubacteria group bacterium GW2011_GWD2_38_12]KKQ59063.1 MAG: hypothetical protein US79_C0001G0062 [Parcubacteria group bacterium GW2011_GWC1_38_17]KKQ59678.1 MAG: hypothetical protein US78_C0001G0038 [Parcubacteria group bacterium GW2011_GWD1_38_16]KKS70809.1 MAG: hypothetical protein UV42_C0043G0011 [Candidatus Magasanikbacteria bacterium GW2011